MSTGSHHPKNGIKVLTDGRLNRDIMRTLAHEWVHAYQRNVLKREQGPNIGGQNEDEANAYNYMKTRLEDYLRSQTFEEKTPDNDNSLFKFDYTNLKKWALCLTIIQVAISYVILVL